MEDYGGSKRLFSLSAMNNLLDKQKRKLTRMINEVKRRPILRIPSQKEDIMDLVRRAKLGGYKFKYVPDLKEMMLVKSLNNPRSGKRREIRDKMDSIDFLNQSQMELQNRSRSSNQRFFYSRNTLPISKYIFFCNFF